MTGSVPPAQPLLRRSAATADGGAVLLRPASSDDAEALVALRDAVAAEGRWLASRPGERSALEERLALAATVAGGGLSLVAEVDGAVVGHLTVTRGRGEYLAHLGEVAIVVAAGRRGIGIGTALLATALAWARATRIGKLWLGVFPDNERAIAAYRRAGFVEEGRQHDQVRIGAESRDLLLMAHRFES